MAWVMLVIAGLFETGWAIGLKFTNGFTRPLPSILTISAIVISMYLLALAARTLPISTAYSIWVGIGTIGAAILGMTMLGEPATARRIFFLAMLVVAIIGLKLSDQ